MAECLEVIQLGNPILRQKAQPVEEGTELALIELIESLKLTATTNKGVGIAAPQVAQSYRLFILASRPTPRYPYAPVMEPTGIINPKIITHSSETVKDWEGCLSIPGIRGLVPRYQAIEVEYVDTQGHLHHREFTDFIARIFQHELDHLDGIVFLDRVESTQDLYSEQEYQKLING